MDSGHISGDPLHQARLLIRKELGTVELARLHKPIPWVDRLIPWVAILLFLSQAAGLALLPFGVVWACLFLLQGILVMQMAYIYHDLFVHRDVFKTRFANLLAQLLTFPAQLSATKYRYSHLTHHRLLNIQGDTEEYKMDLDTRWKRLIFLTAVGIKLSFGGYFASHKGRLYPRSVPRDDVAGVAAVQRELRLSRALFVAVLALAILFPKVFLFGYLLPLLTVTPILNTIRIVLEHFEVRVGDGFQIATAYKTGFFSRYAFFWGAGDCHIVHHLFPRIPFYRINAALRSMTPIFQSAGVIQRRSLGALLYFWLFVGSPHRSVLPRHDAVSDQHA